MVAFAQSGEISSGISGPVPLTWSEIANYCAVTSFDPLPWEAQDLRRMSIEYLTGMREGTDPLNKPPPERFDDDYFEIKDDPDDE